MHVYIYIYVFCVGVGVHLIFQIHIPVRTHYL